jgi:eukaryotic-like serine/threonine-protein kinase
VSQAGGIEPRWRRDGKELFFFAPDNRLMAAQVEMAGSDLRIGGIEGLFYSSRKGFGAWRYDVTHDGQTFLVVNAVPDPALAPLTLVLNWTEKLRQ